MYLLISRNGNGVYILSEGMMGFCIIQRVYTTGLYLPVPLVPECHVLFHFLMSPWPSFSVPRFPRSKLIIIISYPAIIKWISIEHIVIIAGQIDKSFPYSNQMDLLFPKFITTFMKIQYMPSSLAIFQDHTDCIIWCMHIAAHYDSILLYLFYDLLFVVVTVEGVVSSLNRW